MEELRKGSETEKTRDHPIKILGLSWDTCEDCFRFELDDLVKFVGLLPPTKRSLLQVSPKVLGFLSPCTILVKIIFQQLCLDKVSWDDRLEGEALKKWNSLIHEFSASYSY